jgi:hypothetical protein
MNHKKAANLPLDADWIFQTGLQSVHPLPAADERRVLSLLVRYPEFPKHNQRYAKPSKDEGSAHSSLSQYLVHDKV